MRSLLFAVLLLTVPATQAQMYKCTEGGKTRFSDKPIADCKNVEVKGQANTYAGEPAPSRGRASRERMEADNKCFSLRQEHARLQRAPDTPEREQRMQDMRADYAACR
ncbi:MAG: hypothetical protein QOD26_2415 [Betaproteobacteria bacterium]|jgi:hypothetical protein|nr:hypothetical protein [Betaproteobacteria bacterium]